MSKRATKAEIDYRVQLFAEAIANGLTNRQDLLRLSATEGWELQPRQVDNYITKALEVFKQRSIETIDIQRNKRVKQLEHLMHLNYAKGDYTECRHLIKSIADIEGLVQSRFADKPEENPGIAVVSRFKDNWEKASGKE